MGINSQILAAKVIGKQWGGPEKRVHGKGDTMANIFLKSCPECANRIAVGANACSCGYMFESGEIKDLLTVEARARDEQLYEEYLRARAQQAHEAARLATELAERDPQDPEKARIAALERLAVEQAEAELAAQAARVAAMTKALDNDLDRRAYAAA